MIIVSRKRMCYGVPSWCNQKTRNQPLIRSAKELFLKRIWKVFWFYSGKGIIGSRNYLRDNIPSRISMPRTVFNWVIRNGEVLDFPGDVGRYWIQDLMSGCQIILWFKDYLPLSAENHCFGLLIHKFVYTKKKIMDTDQMGCFYLTRAYPVTSNRFDPD